jgi:hypothetical protein
MVMEYKSDFSFQETKHYSKDINYYVHSTQQYNPEDSSEHHTRRHENLKSPINYWYNK